MSKTAISIEFNHCNAWWERFFLALGSIRSIKLWHNYTRDVNGSKPYYRRRTGDSLKIETARLIPDVIKY